MTGLTRMKSKTNLPSVRLAARESASGTVSSDFGCKILPNAHPVGMSRSHVQPCPIAASLNQLGDMWTLLIVREALNGATRFSHFQRNTGIAKTLLSDRLDQMVRDGLLERHDIGQRGVRHEYRLTKKGRGLVPVMVAISQWGNAWLYGEGKEPVALVHRHTGDPIAPLRPANADGQTFEWRNVQMVPGPGADDALLARFASSRSTKE